MKILYCLVIIVIIGNSAIAQEDVYKSLEVNDFTMHFRDIGNGPVLLLLHGFSGTGETWNPFLKDLSSQYRLIIPDLRGHGRSFNTSGIFTHNQLALDVFDLLDQLGIQNFKAIGMSMGAITLLHASTQQRNRIESMVLVGGTPYLPEKAREIYRKSDPSTVTEVEMEQYVKIHKGGKEQVLQLFKQFYEYKDSYEDVNFTKPYLTSINSQTLIVHGDRDEFFPADLAFEMYQSIPNSFLWIVPNGTHTAGIRSENYRPIFIDLVLDFLSGKWIK